MTHACAYKIYILEVSQDMTHAGGFEIFRNILNIFEIFSLEVLQDITQFCGFEIFLKTFFTYFKHF